MLVFVVCSQNTWASSLFDVPILRLSNRLVNITNIANLISFVLFVHLIHVVHVLREWKILAWVEIICYYINNRWRTKIEESIRLLFSLFPIMRILSIGYFHCNVWSIWSVYWLQSLKSGVLMNEKFRWKQRKDHGVKGFCYRRDRPLCPHVSSLCTWERSKRFLSCEPLQAVNQKNVLNGQPLTGKLWITSSEGLSLFRSSYCGSLSSSCVPGKIFTSQRKHVVAVKSK